MGSKIKKPLIVGIGEIFFDIMPDSRKLGGAPYDFLRYAVKHGANASIISAIGADDLGREVVSELNKSNVHPVLAITPYPTGRVVIFEDACGFNSHILENAAWDYIPYTADAENTVKNADAVYFDTLALRKDYSKNTILDLIDMVPDCACKFFDINLRKNYYQSDLISELIKRADILKLNIDELNSLIKLFDLKGNYECVSLQLKETYNLNYLILTKDTTESIIYGNKEITRIKNNNLKQIFARGAGNAFSGVFLSEILQGKTQQIAHEMANLVAKDVCQPI